MAKITSSSEKLKIKLIYNYTGSVSLSEFFIPSNIQSNNWLIPNSIKDWFNWFGIAICNPNDTQVTVTLKAYFQGNLIGEKMVTINPNDKFVDLSVNIWEGTDYSSIDMVIISSDIPISPPLSITGNSEQDRHVFFLGKAF